MLEPDIYFDNAATTMVKKEVVEKISNLLVNHSANPSALHKLGIAAKKILENSRGIVSRVINCESNEFVFTSSGSESNMIAILGAIKPKFRNGNRIITSAVEHKSVLTCCKKLESLGYEVLYVKPKSNGELPVSDFEELVNEKTMLVSVMQVNNETGDIYPIENIVRAVKKKNSNTLFHCDAAQSIGKLDCDVKKLGVDVMSFSGHKIGAPQGIGGLFVKSGLKFCLVEGGTQEFGIRMGTENLSGVVGLAEVFKLLNPSEIKKRLETVELLKGTLVEELAKFQEVKINSSPGALPYVLNFSVLGVPSQLLVNRLGQDGVFIGSGAACSQKSKSHVLKALGLQNNIVESAVRISFFYDNTLEEVLRFVKILKNAICEIRSNSTRRV
jgi:cysteine desulfurase